MGIQNDLPWNFKPIPEHNLPTIPKMAVGSEKIQEVSTNIKQAAQKIRTGPDPEKWKGVKEAREANKLEEFTYNNELALAVMRHRDKKYFNYATLGTNYLIDQIRNNSNLSVGQKIGLGIGAFFTGLATVCTGGASLLLGMIAQNSIYKVREEVQTSTITMNQLELRKDAHELIMESRAKAAAKEIRSEVDKALSQTGDQTPTNVDLKPLKDYLVNLREALLKTGKCKETASAFRILDKQIQKLDSQISKNENQETALP